MSRSISFATQQPAPDPFDSAHAFDTPSISQAVNAAPDMAMFHVPQISAKALQPAGPAPAKISLATKRGIRARRRANRH